MASRHARNSAQRFEQTLEKTADNAAEKRNRNDPSMAEFVNDDDRDDERDSALTRRFNRARLNFGKAPKAGKSRNFARYLRMQ